MKQQHIVLSPYSLLVVSESSIRRLKTPFDAIALTYFEQIRKGETIRVTRVSSSKDCPLLYLIQGKLYEYRYFRVLN